MTLLATRPRTDAPDAAERGPLTLLLTKHFLGASGKKLLPTLPRGGFSLLMRSSRFVPPPAPPPSGQARGGASLLLRVTRDRVAPYPAQRRVEGRLGCGVWTVAIHERGGGERVGWLPATELSGERVLSATSTATATAPNASCSDLAALIRPWDHELHLYRNGRRAWLGPIRQKRYTQGQVVLSASDLSVWPARRLIPVDLALVDADLVAIFAAIIDAAMQPDPSPLLQVVWAALGVTGARSYYAAAHPLAGEKLAELASTGVDWTVLRRRLYAGPALPLPISFPTLRDAHFAEQPDVLVDGDQQANQVVVTGAGSSDTLDPIAGASTDQASADAHGLLASVQRDSNIGDGPSAQSASDSRLELVSEAPVIFSGGRLAATAPVTFDQLLAGALVPVELARTGPVSGTYRLRRVAFRASSTQAEEVSIETQPTGTAIEGEG